MKNKLLGILAFAIFAVGFALPCCPCTDVWAECMDNGGNSESCEADWNQCIEDTYGVPAV